MSEALETFRRAIAAATRATDPIKEAKALGAALDVVPEVQRLLRQRRRDAVVRITTEYPTMSFSDIGEELGGLSKQRVNNILKEHNSGGDAARAARQEGREQEGRESA